MDQTLLVEAGKHGLAFLLMAVVIVALVWLVRALWEELRKERDARINLVGEVITVTKENTAALNALRDLIRQER